MACGPSAPHHEEPELPGDVPPQEAAAPVSPTPTSSQAIDTPQQAIEAPQAVVASTAVPTTAPAVAEAEPVADEPSGVADAFMAQPPEPEPTAISAQSGEGSGGDDPEPTPTLWPTAHPTPVGADSEKYPNMKGIVRAWAVAIDETRERQQSEGSSGESDAPIVPDEATLESKGGVITAVVMVDGAVVNAKVKIIQWLEDNELEYYDHGGSLSVQFNAAQLDKMGPLSQLEAVYEVRDPIRIYPQETPRPGYASEDGTGPPGPPRPSDGN